MSTASALTTDTNAAMSYASLSASKKETASVSKTDEAQSRFLKLLTTQLKNQDPLNPVDNAQTTSQLAQISTVDGIERLNETLQGLVGSYRSSETLQAAALVGHAVLVEGDKMQLSGGSAYGGFELDKSADRVSISIRDANGLEVANEVMTNLEAGSHDFVWDGKTLDGSVAVDGKYSIKVTATKGTADVTSKALEFATVTGVNNTSTGITIDAGRFSKLSLSDVRRII